VPAYGDPRQQVEHRREHLIGELRCRQTHARGEVVGVDDDLHLPGDQPVVKGEGPALPGDQDRIVELARGEHGGQSVEQVVDQRGERGRPRGGLGVAAGADADVHVVVMVGPDPGGARVVLQQGDRRLCRRLRPDQRHRVPDLGDEVVGQSAHRHARAGALVSPLCSHLRAARQVGGDARAGQEALTLGVVHTSTLVEPGPGPRPGHARVTPGSMPSRTGPTPFRWRTDALGRLAR
jgi:hypothetical protein